MSRLPEGERHGILERLERAVPPEIYRTWCRNLHLESVSENLVEVPVPNSFCRDWLEREIRRPLEDAFRGVFGRVPEIVFRISDSPEAMAVFAAPMGDTPPLARPAPVPAAPARPGEAPGLDLNPAYTFDSFVTGPTNRIAHAAAVAVSESPAALYNPFFLHGGVGLGKTHLLQALCHGVLARDPGARILYLSCETFVNEYINALNRKRIDAFRSRMRGADVLVIDDVHFLAGKESSQEEFFHTFNALHLAGRQIILSSDSGPKDIRALKEQLVSRFLAGFEARVEAPTFEMRVAILRRKAEARHQHVPDDVLSHVASRVETNIRELEGAVIKLIAYATLSNRPVDLALAREVLRDLGSGPARVGVPRIQGVVAKYYGLRESDLKSRTWTKSTSKARQVAMFLCKEFTSHSLAEIGATFGGKDHSTIVYGIRRVAAAAAQDPALAAELDDLRRLLKSGGE